MKKSLVSKLLAVALSAAMLVGLTACGGSAAPAPASEPAAAVEEAGGQYYKEPDRQKAIAYALSIAQPGDIILLAGKGHETYQLVNGVKEPFSELDCINAYMRSQKTND